MSRTLLVSDVYAECVVYDRRGDGGVILDTNSVIFFVKQKTAYEMRISDWSSDVCSSDLTSAQIYDSIRRSKIDRHVLRRELEISGEKHGLTISLPEIGRASCRERVCQYV